MQNLTLIIPTKKEVESLPIFLKEIENYNCKKLIVLEKEDIETKKILEEFNNINILEQKNNGYGNALIEGINEVQTDFCCIINADGSMDPKYLDEMLNLCKNKDLVFASRYLKDGGSDDDNFITLIGNKIFSFIGNIFFGLNLSDILYTYILGKTSSAKKLSLQYSDFRICVEIPILAKFNNYQFVSTPSMERKRIGGKKKVNAFKDGLLILLSMIRLFFRKIH